MCIYFFDFHRLGNTYSPWRGDPPSPPETVSSKQFSVFRKARSPSDGWAISILRCITLIQGIVGHREGDFDIGAHLSHIILLITVNLYRLNSNYPTPSISIVARSAQIRKELFIIWLYFHLLEAFYCYINTYIHEQD